MNNSKPGGDFHQVKYEMTTSRGMLSDLKIAKQLINKRARYKGSKFAFLKKIQTKSKLFRSAAEDFNYWFSVESDNN